MVHAVDTASVLLAAQIAGLDAVGICTAEPFDETRAEIERRKETGLADTMQFTFRNPTRSTDPAHTITSVETLVVGALCYRRDDVGDADRSMSAPARIADYAAADFYGPLRTALSSIADLLIGAGYRARVLADDNALVDRAAAHRAGLGWFGKNANLLLPGRGSQFVLGSVLTDAPLEPNASIEADGCGTCRRCIVACPTDAIVESGVIDARRCLAWLVQRTGVFPREHRVALGDRIYGCDDCQTSCPVNRNDVPVRTSTAEVERWTDAIDMLEMTDADLLENYGRWYIPRREARYLRRNALIVVGNTADPEDERTIGALRRQLDSGDEIVIAHAVWAARRLGRDDLVAQLDCGRTAMIRAELDADVTARKSD